VVMTFVGDASLGVLGSNPFMAVTGSPDLQ
jgi:hypothetical protein